MRQNNLVDVQLILKFNRHYSLISSPASDSKGSWNESSAFILYCIIVTHKHAMQEEV